MECNFDFKELSDDADIIRKLQTFSKSVAEIEEVLQKFKDPEIYDKLTNAEKIKYNHLMTHSLNSLFWMYLRAEGTDPEEHPIKHEIVRFKESLNRAKQIEDRNTIMPRINKGAAERFIRHGLWVPVEKSNELNDQSNEEIPGNKSEESW